MKPSVAERLKIMLFQRYLLFAHHHVDPEIVKVALKDFYELALQWQTPINVALSILDEVPLYTIGAVKTGLFPVSIDALC